MHAVERVGDPLREPLALLAGEVADLAHHHDAALGHERRALHRVHDRRERRELQRRRSTSSSSSSAAVVGVGRAAPARLDRVVVERERPVDAAEQLVDDALHLAVAQARIGSLHQRGGHERVTSGAGSDRRLATSSASTVRHTRAAAEHVVHPHDAAAARDAVRDRGQRLVAPVVDLAAEQLADEPLVRRRQQERVAEPGVHRRLPQQHRALRGRLAEVEPGVEHDLLGLEPGGLGAARPLEQERGDVGDEVVVVRIGIGDARPQPDVGRDDGRVVLRPRRVR